MIATEAPKLNPERTSDAPADAPLIAENSDAFDDNRFSSSQLWHAIDFAENANQPSLRVSHCAAHFGTQ